MAGGQRDSELHQRDIVCNRPVLRWISTSRNDTEFPNFFANSRSSSHLVTVEVRMTKTALEGVAGAVPMPPVMVPLREEESRPFKNGGLNLGGVKLR